MSLTRMQPMLHHTERLQSPDPNTPISRAALRENKRATIRNMLQRDTSARVQQRRRQANDDAHADVAWEESGQGMRLEVFRRSQTSQETCLMGAVTTSLAELLATPGQAMGERLQEEKDAVVSIRAVAVHDWHQRVSLQAVVEGMPDGEQPTTGYFIQFHRKVQQGAGSQNPYELAHRTATSWCPRHIAPTSGPTDITAHRFCYSRASTPMLCRLFRVVKSGEHVLMGEGSFLSGDAMKAGHDKAVKETKAGLPIWGDESGLRVKLGPSNGDGGSTFVRVMLRETDASKYADQGVLHMASEQDRFDSTFVQELLRDEYVSRSDLQDEIKTGEQYLNERARFYKLYVQRHKHHQNEGRKAAKVAQARHVVPQAKEIAWILQKSCDALQRLEVELARNIQVTDSVRGSWLHAGGAATGAHRQSGEKAFGTVRRMSPTKGRSEPYFRADHSQSRPAHAGHSISMSSTRTNHMRSHPHRVVSGEHSRELEETLQTASSRSLMLEQKSQAAPSMSIGLMRSSMMAAVAANRAEHEAASMVNFDESETSSETGSRNTIDV